MQLLDYVVRDDWRELTREMRREQLSLWRGVLGLAVLSSLAILLLVLLLPQGYWRDTFRTLLSSCLFIVFPLYVVNWFRDSPRRRAAASLMLLTGSAVVGRMTRPRPGAEQPPGFVVLALLGSLAMLTTWIVLMWALRRKEREVEKLGLTTDRWRVDILLGVLIGAALASNLALGRKFAGLTTWWRPSWILLLWHLCFSLGLQGLGSELLFRGLGYRLLREQLGRGYGRTLGELTLLSFLPQLALRAAGFSGSFDAWVLPYLAGMAAINTGLRAWRGSLVPGIACHAAFSVFTLLLTSHAI